MGRTDEAKARSMLSTLRECYPSDQVLAEQLDGEWHGKTLSKAARGQGCYEGGLSAELKAAVRGHYKTLRNLHVVGEEALVMAVQTVERIRSCETMGQVQEATDRLDDVLNSKLAEL